jgi:16S rRNA (cytidine1402-2'-O)-methyltransferase
MAKLIAGSMPIGNMEDISIRMIRLIKESKFIIVEDEEFVKKNLAEIGVEIVCPVFAIGNTDIGYHGNEAVTITKQKLEEGIDVLVISDEGCPSLGEPTSTVISEIGKSGYQIETVPGPSIVSSAMVHISAHSKGFANNVAYVSLSFHDHNFNNYTDFVKKNIDIPTICVVNHQMVDAGIFDDVIEKTGDRNIMILSNMSVVGEEKVIFSTFENIKNDRPDRPFTVVVMPNYDQF